MALRAACQQTVKEAARQGRTLIAQVHPGTHSQSATGQYRTIFSLSCASGGQHEGRYENRRFARSGLTSNL